MPVSYTNYYEREEGIRCVFKWCRCWWVDFPSPAGSKTTSKTRSGDAKRRVLDNATRQRRQKRQLESLEKDNSHDDPHAAFAHLAAKTKLPTFSDGSESTLLGAF